MPTAPRHLLVYPFAVVSRSTSVRLSSAMMRALGALVTLVALAGCSSAEHRASSATAAPEAASTSASLTTTTVALDFDVPWVDRPALEPLFEAPAPTTPLPADARPCAADDVSVTAEGSDQAGTPGSTRYFFAFKNVGATTCALGGYPSRVLGTSSIHASVRARNGIAFENVTPANISPGQAADYSVQTPNLCYDVSAPPPSSGVIAVTVPGGGEVTLPGEFDLTCELSTGQFGLPPPPPIDPPKWFLGLTVSLTVPATVDAGSTLSYVMTLGNSTTHTIRFARCPGYAEGVLGPHVEITAFHALNCDQVRAIPASGRVRYEMRLRIPRDTPTGDFALAWMTLLDAEAPTANTRLHVRGSD